MQVPISMTTPNSESKRETMATALHRRSIPKVFWVSYSIVTGVGVSAFTKLALVLLMISAVNWFETTDDSIEGVLMKCSIKQL